MVHSLFLCPGARAYYLRHVLHDYSDKVCAKILRQLVSVMAPDSVILVSDYIVPVKITPSDVEVATAGMVMCSIGGKERSEEDLVKLFEEVGLVLSGVFKPEFDHHGLVEARLKGASDTSSE